ncbi:MAG: polysaccharide biosynthesis/export family protein [Burkholderiales bacterium]|jgi:exopolysaccharide production protein ExoF|nr:polysaccharide biosynthesis/export family protein [Burkholderiales bacterium]
MKQFAMVLACAGLVLTSLGQRSMAQELRYKLGIQDRVRVHVHEWPALTGEFTIGANGDVTLPLIGQLRAAGLETSELAAAVGARLRAKVELLQAPDTAVDVVQYRPFYILGYVDRPGEYPFRPGMLVLNAVSIGGGMYRPARGSSTDWGLQRDAITARGDIRVVAVRRQELEARRFRLEAEVQAQENFPPIPADISNDLRRVIEEEKALFQSRLDRVNNQVESYNNTIDLLEREIVAIQGQIGANQRQRDSVMRELEDTRGMVSRGLAPAPRVLPLERTVSQLESEQKAMETMILRARQQINLTRAQISSARDERRAVAASDLLALRVQAQELTERYNTLVRVMADSSDLIEIGDERDSTEQIVVPAYTIVRVENGEVVERSVSETTRVQPGDIIKVTRVQSKPATSRRPDQLRTGTVQTTAPTAAN